MKLTGYCVAKHFLNDPETLVVDSLQGLCTLNPQLGFEKENKGAPFFATSLYHEHKSHQSKSKSSMSSTRIARRSRSSAEADRDMNPRTLGS